MTYRAIPSMISMIDVPNRALLSKNKHPYSYEEQNLFIRKLNENENNLHQLILLHLYISPVVFHHHHIDQFYFQQELQYNHLPLIPLNINK